MRRQKFGTAGIIGGLVVLLSLVWLLTLAASGGIPEEYETIREIRVFESPGVLPRLFHESEPAEAIMARRDGDGCFLIAQDNIPRDSHDTYLEDSVALSQAEWDTLIAIAARERLLEFAPKPLDVQVVDFGYLGFSVTGVRRNRQGWSRPLCKEDQAVVLPLFAEMAKLTNDKLPSVELHYLSRFYTPESQSKQGDDLGARELYRTFIETVRSAHSLSWDDAYRFSASGEEGRCSFRIWLEKPGFGRMEAVMPSEVTGMGETVTGVIVGDGESYWIYWPAGFPGTRPWDPGQSNTPVTNLYMQRRFKPAKYSFSHESRQLGSCMVMLAFQPSVFFGQVDTPLTIEAIAPLGVQRIDNESCDGILLSMADGQRTMEYWLARSDHLPRRIKAVAHVTQDVVVEEAWTSVHLNEDMPDSLFRWTPPDGFVEYFEPALESALLPVGAEAPDFEAPLLGGGSFRLSDHRGEIVLLSFFRIGCPPCREQLPVLEGLYRRFGNEGLVVLGYDEIDEQSILRAQLSASGVTYPCVLDTSDARSRLNLGYTTSDYGGSDPLTYLVGRDGRIVARWFGFSEKNLIDELSRAGFRR